MGRIKHIASILNLYERQLAFKNLFVCAVGILPDEQHLQDVLDEKLHENLKHIHYYKLPGRVHYDELSRFEKFIYRAIAHSSNNSGQINRAKLDEVIDDIKQNE